MRALALTTTLLLVACGGPNHSNQGGWDAGVFFTLAPGSTLPSDQECATRVLRSSFEPRPDNATANARTPTSTQLSTFHADTWGGVDPRANSDLRQRVTGAFTGTTDEIIQWGACKWGFDVEVIRAQAATESWWHQSATGDLTTNTSLWPPGATCQDASHCFQSYGLLQIKWVYWQSAWPNSRDSTAFNVDATLAWRRVCFEGLITWGLTPGTAGYPNYGPGDLWGCTGQWFSGRWYDSGAINYIGDVRSNLTNKVWLQSGF